MARPTARTALLAATLGLVAGAAAASALAARPPADSLASFYGLDVQGFTHEELAGDGVDEPRLYVADEASHLTFKARDVIYDYVLKGERHQERAAALWGALVAGRLESFVAAKKGTRVGGFTDVRPVKALLIGAAAR